MEQQNSLLIKNAKQLLTMSGDSPDSLGMIPDGWLYIENGVIAAVGNRDMVEPVSRHADAVIDATGNTVLPGFVDCHTHVVFGGSRVTEYAVKLADNNPETLKRLGVKTGIHATVDMTRDLPIEKLAAQTERRLLGMLAHGTTTMESKSGYGLTTHSELKMLEINRNLNRKLPIDIVSCFLGAHGWPEDMKKDKYMDILVEEMIPAVSEQEMAAYCDVWCDDGMYTAAESMRILKAGMDFGMIPRIHTDAYSYVGGSDLAADLGMASADHLNYTPNAVYRKLAEAGVVGVVLPVIEFAVAHPKPVCPRVMLDAGMTLAVATNCCPGCWVESMQIALTYVCRLHAMSPEEAIRAATFGGAAALRLDDRGVLAVGKKADVQIWDVETYEDVVYKYGRNHVKIVIKNGIQVLPVCDKMTT